VHRAASVRQHTPEIFHRTDLEAAQPPARERHLNDEEDRDGQHQVERRTDLAPQAEAPVIEQRHCDQRLQQIVGERHASGERDGCDALAPTLVAHRANDRRHVENHDRNPAQHIAFGGEDAADRRFPGIAGEIAPGHEADAADQADAERPPLCATDQRQVRRDVLEELTPAEQQAEQYCREELHVSSDHAGALRMRVVGEHRLGTAPGRIEEVAVPERRVVRGDGLLCQLDAAACGLLRRGRHQDRSHDGRIEQAHDDERDDCPIGHPAQQQQHHAQQCIHVQNVASPEDARVDRAEHE
jgi:hypothetical protein